MYGDRLLSGGQDFVKRRMGFFSGSMFHYYFHVDMRYVRRKLKIVLAPFLHRGSWTRIPDPVAGDGAYKSPQQDANAPDLYIPIMSFFTYLVLCSFALMRQRRLNPDAVSYCLWTSMAAWALQVLLLKTQLFMMSSQTMPLRIAWLDLVCYGGYAFTQVALQQFAALFSKHVYWAMVGYGTLCTGMFLIKTMKRIVFAEARYQGRDFDPKRHNYTLLLLALVQFPLSLYLGVTGLTEHTNPSGKETSVQRALQHEIRQGETSFTFTQFLKTWHLLLAAWVWGHASL